MTHIPSEQIRKAIVAIFDQSWSNISGRSRRRDYVDPRKAYCFFMRRHTKLGLTEIGATVGGRDHAMVIYFSKRAAELKDNDKEFKHKMDRVEKMILGDIEICETCKQPYFKA